MQFKIKQVIIPISLDVPSKHSKWNYDIFRSHYTQKNLSQHKRKLPVVITQVTEPIHHQVNG